jgi:hypothetical protein
VQDLLQHIAIAIKRLRGTNDVGVVVVVLTVLKIFVLGREALCRSELPFVLRLCADDRCQRGTNLHLIRITYFRGRPCDANADSIRISIQHARILHFHTGDLSGTFHYRQDGVCIHAEDAADSTCHSARIGVVVEQLLRSRIDTIHKHQWRDGVSATNRRQRNSVHGTIGCLRPWVERTHIPYRIGTIGVRRDSIRSGVRSKGGVTVNRLNHDIITTRHVSNTDV